jgi:hypothetical protein
MMILLRDEGKKYKENADDKNRNGNDQKRYHHSISIEIKSEDQSQDYK